MSSAQNRRDVARIVRQLQRTEYGCEVSRTGSRHWKVVKPGHQPVFISHSPSDAHAMRNIRADIRRHLGISV